MICFEKIILTIILNNQCYLQKNKDTFKISQKIKVNKFESTLKQCNSEINIEYFIRIFL